MENLCGLLKAQDGKLLPVVRKDGKEIRFGSVYNGNYAAERYLDYYVSIGAEYAILFGMGDCQIVLGLAERLPGYIMVYEPEESLYRAMSETPAFKKLQSIPRVMITCGDQGFSEFEELVRELLNEGCVETTLLLSSPGYNREYPKEWKRVQRLCRTVCDEVDFMKPVARRFVKAMLHNQLENLSYMKDGILLARLKKYWDPELPVIIVSAGPSLEKNIGELKKAKGRAFIFCADAALPSLLKADIIPDVVGCTDAKKNMNCFEDERSLALPLLITTNSPVALIHKSTGAKIWGDDLAFIREILIKSDVDIPKIPSYLGVSTTLFASVLELGTKTIILVGQDLAYSTEGKSHVSGRDEGFVKDDRFLTEGYYGDMIYSRGDWTVFREWMEKAIQAFPDREVINATEGGAKIKGTIQRPLQGVVEEMTEWDASPAELFENPQVKMTSKEFQKVMREFRKGKEDLEKIRKDGYEKTFFQTNYLSVPVMRLVIDYMKSLEEPDRKARFYAALECVYEEYSKKIEN
ncbi:MAG: motility associated factor glycosyltransferase family protein [Lachnospiraceae bacterium]|nr:motility associated factor glycosyltransferase family protein [Lachnospiraceae bacterium]